MSLDSPDLAKADVVVLGAPIDWGASYRGGARFGPKAIREADYLPANMSRSHLLTGIDPSKVMSVIGAGDIAVAPGCLELDT
jgi:agmatinase